MQRQMNPESRTMLPKMAFTGFASRYREPTVDEGFDDITKVNFKVRLTLVGIQFNTTTPLLPPPSPAATCLQHRILTLDTGSSMGPRRKRPNGASTGYLDQIPFNLRMWLRLR